MTDGREVREYRSDAELAQAISPGWSTIGTRPDWVIIGSPWDQGQVMILASKSLDEAQLVYEAQAEPLYVDEYLSPTRFAITHRDYRLEVHFRPDSRGEAFVMITAPTYAEAFRHLMEHWSPEDTTPDGHWPRKEVERR